MNTADDETGEVLYFYLSDKYRGEKTTLVPRKIRQMNASDSVRCCDTIAGCITCKDEYNLIAGSENTLTFYAYAIDELPYSNHFQSNFDVISSGNEVAEITGEVRFSKPVKAHYLGEVTVNPKSFDTLVYNSLIEEGKQIPLNLYHYEIKPIKK